MTLKNKTILIGFADALSAPEVAFSLMESGFSVTAFLKRHSPPPALCKCKAVQLIEVTALEDDANKTVAELKSIYKSLQAVAVMPLNDKSVWLCDKLSTDPEIIIAGPTGKQAQLALDKRIQVRAALSSGFNVPHTSIIENYEDTEKINFFPLVLKPALAVAECAEKLLNKGTISLHFCVNRQEFDKAINEWDGKQPLLAQTIHKGHGEGLFGLATPSDVYLWSAHHRVRMMNPKGSGASACRSIPISDHPITNAKDMLLKANWQGMFMIELLRDESDKLWFIELNGRSWGSMALALRMGFQYPVWTVMQKLDHAFIPLPPEPHEYVTCRHFGRELIHLLQVLRGPNSSAIPNWPSFWRSCIDVFHISKKDRWYNWRPDQAAVFIYDTYKTVMDETVRKWIKK
jgi:predicted ATP-grasp superfamily ATP-dependent carboligase